MGKKKHPAIKSEDTAVEPPKAKEIEQHDDEE
jgi:hypothetical protein